MVASWRPDLAVQVAFNANPNDPAATPSWTDLTTLFRGASAITRGRQYELDQNQGSRPTLAFFDQNEYLNPANSAGPYAPNVVPYRQILVQAMWPNGGTGNLLNTGVGYNPQLGTTSAGMDPSFETSTPGAAVPWLTAVGATSPVVGTTTPHTGSQDVTWTVVNGATAQGVSWMLPCIPGRQYTTSAYARQTSASTQQIAVTGVATGSSTVTTGSWVRLAVTFTATQPVHTLTVQTSGTAVAGTVLLDDVQHEPGASVSTFTTTGPVIYGLLRHYVERWPATWEPDSAGFLGLCDVTSVDAFAPLNIATLSTEYVNAVLAKTPDRYYRLAETTGTTFADSSTGHGPDLTGMNSKYGQGPTFTAGAATNITGDPAGVGLAANTAAVTTNIPATVAQVGANNNTNLGFNVTLGTSGTTGYTVAFWWAHGALTASVTQWALGLGTYADTSTPATVGVSATPGTPNQLFFSLLLTLATGSNNVNLSVTDTYADSKPHLYVLQMQYTSSTGKYNALVYIDGALATSSGATTATGSGQNTMVNQMLQVGGYINHVTLVANPAVPSGVYSHVALWSRALSTAEISDLWNAGKGYVGETSGARVARYLGYAFTGLTSIDTGQSVMGTSNLSAGTTLLSACQAVTTSENGNLWVDSWGNTTFAARTRRYLATSSMYTFGEHTAGGENPYLGDIRFSSDPTLLYEKVTVTNTNGYGVTATSSTGALAYFPRAYPRSVNLQNNNEVVDAATYLLNQHDNPLGRVEQITLDPVGNPTMWPVVLSLEIGMRVTVVRRSPAANGGAGLTSTADFFVEKVSHDGIDMQAGTWLTTLYLSPVDVNQVGILDSSTLGRLGSGGAATAGSLTATATTVTVDSTSGVDVFTTTGTPFSATIDSEVVTVTAVTNAATDGFTRTVSGGWGTADSGQSWSVAGGAGSSDFSVGAGVGQQSNGTVNSLRYATLDVGCADFDVTADSLIPVATPAGAAAGTRVFGRFTSTSSYYFAWLLVTTTGAVQLQMWVVVGGVGTQIGSTVTVGTGHLATDWWRVRLQATGTTVRVKAWLTTGTEPTVWTITGTNATLTTGTQVGCASRLESGNTNTLPVVCQFDNLAVTNPQTFTITRPVDGTAVAHSAAAPVQVVNPFVLAY